MITWITEKVAIGERADFIECIKGASKELFKKERIDCVLDLTVNSDPTEPLFCNEIGIPYFHIAVGRHQGLEEIKIELRTAAYMLDQLTKKYSRILVHCTAGIDRAPFVVGYWLISENNEIDLESFSKRDLKFWMGRAYELIAEKRPQIRRHMEWV